MSTGQTEQRFQKLSANKVLNRATFAGGCFWCLQAPFDATAGVVATFVGFAGPESSVPPNYDSIHSPDSPPYREAISLFFDPQQVSYAKLLDIFWLQIDATDSGGQFADRGFEYTTAIYTHTQDQYQQAETSKKQQKSVRADAKLIVTAIEEFRAFYLADEDHQQFYQKQPERYRRYSTLSGRKAFIEARQHNNS